MLFPKSVYFIVGNQFCEGFCYYGMRSVLFLYLMEILRYPKETATVIYHTFTMLVFFFPIISAIIADSWFGKYRTILYLSIVYAIGQILLSASSVPWFHLPIREMTLLGLFLIATGTGGIKSCVPTLGAEQFKIPEQKAQLSYYFTAFFVAVNSAALISTFVTPILRKDVTCFGLNTCYPLAFLVPSILMISALVIFIAGRRMYKEKKPEGNTLLMVATCICHAIKRKIRSSEKRKHWLDYAEDAYETKTIADTKSFLILLKLFIPLSLFYSLYELVASRWTYQATRMDGEVFGYLVKPDQLVSFNILLFLIILFVSDWMIYPVMERFLFINTPLRKITTGCILTATAFVFSGLLELKLESTYVVQPTVGSAHIRIFNTYNCPADLSLDGQNYKLKSFGMYQNLSIPVIGNKSLNYDLNVVCPSVEPLKFTGRITVEEEKTLSYLLRSDGLQIGISDKIDKSETGDPMIRALILTDTGTPTNLSLRLDGSQSYQLDRSGNNFFTNFIEVQHNSYNISVGSVQIVKDVNLRLGGVYTIVGRVSTDGIPQINVVTIAQPNSIHMVWMLPQYISMTLGEAIFLVIGQEFVYVEAPASMKCLAQAIWLFNSAIGNLVVVIITEAHFFNRQAFEFFLYAGLMYGSMVIFTIMAIFYKYSNNSSNDNSTKVNTNLETVHTKRGVKAYSEHL